MTIELLPSGIKCNLKCSYCYQEPMRKAGNYGEPLVFHKAVEVLDKLSSDFALFGGEALLTPLDTLEQIFSYGYKRFQRNGIQTNGLLITQKHIELFKKYNVHVGVSIDGPESLNTARCGSDDTLRIMANICDLTLNGLHPSLIVTLHRVNAGSAYKRDSLKLFFDWAAAIGIGHINLHNLENDGCNDIALSDAENYEVFRVLYDYSKSSSIRFAPFQDIKTLLTSGNPSVSCVWNACDPCTTAAVYGIGPDGSITNCGRTNKQGIDWLKADRSSNARYRALHLTEQEDGGCKGCRYFFACKGQCPGTAIDGDWRNRTKDCRFWYSLIRHIELDLMLEGAVLLDTEEMNRQFIGRL